MSYTRNRESPSAETLDRVHTVGEIGAKILIDLGVDLQGLAATVAVSILALTPTGATKTWTATATPASSTSARHAAGYTTVSGDLSEEGIWYLTPRITWNTGASVRYLTPIRMRVRAVGSP